MTDIKIKINNLIKPVSSVKLKSSLEKSIRGLLKNYGINFSFDLKTVGEDLGPDEIISIEVNNKRIWSPIYLAGQCRAYTINEHVHDLKKDSQILEELKNEKNEIAKLGFLNDYFIESLKLSITELINEETVSELGIESKIPLNKITSIVKELLTLHISLDKYRDRLKNEIVPDTFAEDIVQEFRSKEITIFFSRDYFFDLVNQFDENGEGKIFKTVDELLFYELGFDFSDVKFEFAEIPNGFFKIKINDYETGLMKGISSGKCIIQKDIPGDPDSIIHPASNARWLIIPADQNEDPSLYRLYPFSFIGANLINLYRRFSYLLIDRSLVENVLNELEYTHPALIAILKSKRDKDFITGVFRSLAEEGISIRNFESVFQSIIDFDFLQIDAIDKIIFDGRLTTLNNPDESWRNDPDVIAEFVRLNLKSYITSRLSNSSYALNVFQLDLEIEKLAAQDSFSEDKIAALINAISTEFENNGNQNNPIITTIEVRKKIKNIIQKRFPNLPVTSYQELNPSTNITPISRIYLS